MKRFIFSIPVLLLCLSSHLVYSQSNFNTQDYLQFLADNKDLETDRILSEHSPSNPYFSEIQGTNLEDYLYLDSIQTVFNLTSSELDLLQKNRFMVSERLNYYSFLEAFDRIYWEDLPVFITTDAVLQALHESYGNILLKTEMQILKPKLEGLITALYDHVADLQSAYQSVSGLENALHDVDLYVTIAKSLLDGSKATPQKVDPSMIDAVWDAIQAEQFFSMPLFTDIPRMLDFSQFTLRGYYADVPELHGYFKCMMWLGRMDFVLANAPAEWYDSGFTREGLRRLNLGALLLNELVDLAGVRLILNEIDEIICFMVGESDNMTPPELNHLLTAQGDVSAEDLLDDSVFDSYLESLKSTPEYQQRILSGAVKGMPWTTEPTPLPVSFRLMGQRFIIDSYTFYNVVYDNVVYQGQKICRMMPDPLDVMFALGNDDALPLLKEELDTYHYGSQLANQRYLIDSFDPEFWKSSLYNGWLQAIRELNPPEDETGFPLFMKTTAWHQQKLNTQLASWAQLRHDNLLYAKQSYTHIAACFFPHAYVEPYPDFYHQIAQFAAKGMSISAFNSINEGDWLEIKQRTATEYFVELKEIMTRLEEIARKQLDGTALSEEEKFFFQRMLFDGGFGSGTNFDGWFIDLFFQSNGDNEEGLLTTIADVHTQPSDCVGNIVGKILHVATGHVNLGIFLVDSPSPDCPSAAYVGPVSSYYETITDNFNRMTDWDWMQTFWDNGTLLPDRPDWVNSYLADREGKALSKGRNLPGILYTDVEEQSDLFPQQFSLLQNYPNPFNPQTQIQYTVPIAGEVKLEIYNVLGEKVATLKDGKSLAGLHSALWSGLDDSGREVSAGVYIARLQAGSFSKSIRMLLLK
ncbi:hypothetical protein BVY01_00150 [bacterium I07]|nr:hypothetical protein BVY01_00150 [bacterium I07]